MTLTHLVILAVIVLARLAMQVLAKREAKQREQSTGTPSREPNPFGDDDDDDRVAEPAPDRVTPPLRAPPRVIVTGPAPPPLRSNSSVFTGTYAPLPGQPTMRGLQRPPPPRDMAREVSRGRVTSGTSARAAAPELAARKAARQAEKDRRTAERKARMAVRAASGRARQARGVAARATRVEVHHREAVFSPLARSLRVTFGDLDKLRSAFLVGEVLGKPLADRASDDGDR